MPAQIHSRMKTEGYTIHCQSIGTMLQNTNSLRGYRVIQAPKYTVSKIPVPNRGWSFWNNYHIKYVGRPSDAATVYSQKYLSQFISPAQYEYDICYSFFF